MGGVTIHASQTGEFAQSDAPSQARVCASGPRKLRLVVVMHAGIWIKKVIKIGECLFCLFSNLRERDSSISLVMVLLIEGGLAEEPRAALGCAGGKGHCLQHCIENDKDNSQDRDMTTQFKKSRLLKKFSTG